MNQLSALLALSILVQQESETNFNDLGKLMIGGVIVALLVALAFTFIRLKLRDRKPQDSGFVTIGSNRDDK